MPQHINNCGTDRGIKNLQEEISRIWKEISEIREDLKVKSTIDADIKERLVSLEIRFGTLQNEILKHLEKYRADHQEYLNLYKEQILAEREAQRQAEATKWKLIWTLIALVAAAAGWKITGGGL